MKTLNKSHSPSSILPSEKPTQTTKTKEASKLNAFSKLFGRTKPGNNSFSKPISGNFISLANTPADKIPELKTAPGSIYAVTIDPPLDANSKIQLAIDAELAAYPYHRSLSKIAKATETNQKVDAEFFSPHKNWDTARPLALLAGKAAGLSVKGSEGFIYDKKSGLTAYVLHNNTLSPPEVRLIFGGTSSGKKTGGLFKRSILNGRFSLNQWIANAKNALFGKVPDSYTQAKVITKKLQLVMQTDPHYQNAKLIISGHSKGGGEAAYAALSQAQPPEAICFSSAELGKGVLQSLSETSKANAARYVSHYNIQGDMVPNLSKVHSKLGHVGKVFTIPCISKSDSSIDRHDKFTRHIRHFAAK